MKITKKNITNSDIAEFESIFDKLLLHWELTNEEVIGFYVAHAETLSLDKIRWFFKQDNSRTHNYEKI
jgi:low affinity Fe/Cu permease